MEADDRLIQQMIAEDIGVGKGEIAETVVVGLRESRHGDYAWQQLAGRKCTNLAAIHEEEFPGEMTFIRMIEIEVGDKLIVLIMTGRAECTGAEGRILRGWYDKASIRELRVEQSNCGRRNIRGSRDGSSKNSGLAIEFLRQSRRRAAARIIC